MCVVSMIGDHYKDKWYPTPNDFTNVPYTIPQKINNDLFVTRQEFEQLKKEVKELIELLKRAKKYDHENKEPNCELEEKMDLLKKVAKMVGVNLEDILNK